MSLINEKAIEEILELKALALKGGITYDVAYHRAMRALEKSLTLIQQIDHITQDVKMEVKIG